MQRLRWFVVLAALAFRHAPSPAPESAVATWRLVSAKANGKVSAFPAGTTILKHVTPTDFIFVYYDTHGVITLAGGGKYTLAGGHYQEEVKYGFGEGMAPLIGTTQVFNLRIEGGRWYQTGTETDGTPIEEVWERER